MNGFLAAATDPLVVQSGMICLGIHLLLHGVFAYAPLPDGPWKKMPGHTAHQVLALPLTTYITYAGCLTWFSQTADHQPADTAAESLSFEDRMYVVVPDGVQLAKVVFGYVLYWDIPVGLVIPALRVPLSLVHHLGMLFVAQGLMGNLWVSRQPRGSYYAAFFLGAIQASSIPLALVELFHPKHKYWFEYLQEEANRKKSAVGNLLKSINEVARFLFAVLFLLVRCICFPYVAVSTCLPDYFKAAKSESDPAIFGMFVACFLFTCLQMYRGRPVLRQIAKMLQADDGDDKKKDKKS